MMNKNPNLLSALIAVLLQVSVFASVRGSPHDLSAIAAGDACSFCHTPHKALPKTPGWSHKLSDTVYKIYQSSSLDAKVGQPTGDSKLCLSCHDGTVALSHTRKRGPGGVYITPGDANLGTDLSDDHPISFVYSNVLTAEDSQIRSPYGLPQELKLDRNSELQCTTCHSAHDNTYGDFLVMSNQRSQMCVSCHDLNGWQGSSHESSTASVRTARDQYLKKSQYGSVSENGCQNCHRPHSAGGPERLLHFRRSEDNCLNCHDGSVARANIRTEIAKPSSHNVIRFDRIHDITESPLDTPRHVECVDCHNPHAAQKAVSQSSLISGSMAWVSGVTSSGGPTQQAQYEYEVCYKCHADNPSRVQSKITRDITQTNTRLEFDPSNPSYHPVGSPGVNMDVPSLKLPMTSQSIIRCTDCHRSDSDVKGPHGSNYAPLLANNYTTRDFTSESAYAYALCYDCHSRNSILADESFPLHSKHLGDQIPCSACHDAHGISSGQGSSTNNSHLINFDRVIVAPDSASGRLEFEDLGRFSGRCYLQCHSVGHSPREY
ncbi:MAG: cytochrome c3 family protein [Planctomycetota bacterium]|jgi:predicted CXXCH cytochrome family protein